MSNLSVVSNFADGLEIIHAQSQYDKQAVYDLRYLCEKLRYPEMRSVAQVIDEKDKSAEHLYIRSTSRNKNLDGTSNKGDIIACIRLYQHSVSKPRMLPAIYENDILVFGEPLIHFTAEDFCEADKLYIHPDARSQSLDLKLLLFLTAIAFSRLRFQKFVLSKMDCDQFKALRSKGILFEQTSYSLLNQSESSYFYNSTEDGVSTNTATWGLYQHILDKLAPQINQPDIISHNSNSSAQAKK